MASRGLIREEVSGVRLESEALEASAASTAFMHSTPGFGA